MNQEIKIHIGMRWNSASLEVTLRETERFLSWLSSISFGNDIPVHWNIPSHPYLEMRGRNLNDLLIEIKSRIQRRKDVPVSMGYSGGPHSLYNLKELEKRDFEQIQSPPFDWGALVQTIITAIMGALGVGGPVGLIMANKLNNVKAKAREYARSTEVNEIDKDIA